jgi:hypothetical protein
MLSMPCHTGGRALRRDTGVGPAQPHPAPFAYCNPCIGLPPVVIGAPVRFFGIQLLAGALSVLVLLLCT